MPETHPELIPDDCMNVLRHVWDYLDGRLTAQAAEDLRDHVRACPRCLEYQLFQQSYLAAMERLRAHTAAPWHVRAKVLASLAKTG